MRGQVGGGTPLGATHSCSKLAFSGKPTVPQKAYCATEMLSLISIIQTIKFKIKYNLIVGLKYGKNGE